MMRIALDAKAKLGECPRWHQPSQKLYWVDINRFQLHRFDLASGVDEFLQFGEEIGCFSFRENGGFILAMRSGFYLLEGWDTHLIALGDPESDLEHTRFNDGRCDALGRFFAGTYYPPKDHDGANLWSIDGESHIRKIADDLLTTNGIAFSPDNKVFYYADTPKHCVYRCDYDLSTGRVSNRSVFFQFPHGNGRPDGASVDVEGCYWTALYEGGRIVRISPHGELLSEMTVPVKCPTMVAFGGRDMKTLFVSSAGERSEEELREFPSSGAIFSTEVDVPGLPENNFAF